MTQEKERSDSTFTVATDENLASLIERARQRVIFIAPGITESVAKAFKVPLADPKITVTVILDDDPEVYRLGLGTSEGLAALKDCFDQSHVGIRCQPGIRIGLLIVDDQTLVYSPVPALIEAGSTSPTKPNALFIEGGAASKLADAAGASDNTTPAQGEIGQQALTPAAIEAIKKNLEENPIAPFDLSRKARVYSSRLQYVEFSVEKYKLTRKTVSIPAYLMGLAGDMEDRWRNTLCILDEDITTVELELLGPDKQLKKVAVDERFLEAERKKLESKYLMPVVGFGNVMFKHDQAKFESDVEDFQGLLDDYFEKLKEQVSDDLSNLISKVVGLLLPSVKENPPPEYCRFGKPKDEDLAQLLHDDIESAVSIKTLLVQPTIKKVFKDIAHQSMKSSDFETRLHKALQKAKVPASVIKDVFGESLAVIQSTGSLC